MLGTDLSADLDPAPVLQSNVQYRDVGFRQGNARQGFGHRGRLSHDLYLVVTLEKVADTFTHHLVVVQQENPYRHSAHCASVRPAPRLA